MKDKLLHPATIISLLALFIALSGTSYAISQLPRNSVGVNQLRNNSVTTAKIADNSIIAKKIKNGSLTADDFAAGELPQGPPGSQGVQGPRGEKGDPGIAGISATTEVVAFSISGTSVASKTAPGWANPTITNDAAGAYNLVFGRSIADCQALGSIGMVGDSFGAGQIAVSTGSGPDSNTAYVRIANRLGNDANYPFVVSLVCPN